MRILGRGLATLAVAALAAWLVTAYDSPLNPVTLRVLSALHRRTGADIEWTCRRAGLGRWPTHLRASGIWLRTAEGDTIEVEDLRVHYRARLLLVGRLSLRSIRLHRVQVAAVADPDTPLILPPLPAALDRTRLPHISIQPLTFRLLVIDPEADGPTEAVWTNGFFRANYSTERAAGPAYEFQSRGDLVVNHHEPAALAIHGWLDPQTLDMDRLDLDADLSLQDLPMPALTAQRSRRIPFLADQGTVSLFLSLCAREGRLSGLASLRIRDLTIRPNPGAAGARFLTLGFEAWQFLARQRNGWIDADATLRGTIREPEIPLGHVLQHQAGMIGRNIAIRLFDALPGDPTTWRADRIETERDAYRRHDDILKIARLPEAERHYERGRHYENVVKNYATAVEEYQLQAARFPGEADWAVRALMASAAVRDRHLNDPQGARADLRRILHDYPAHPRADNALYEMIRIAEGRREYPEAHGLCDEFLRRFPRSEFAERVRTLQARIRRFVW